MTEKEHLLTILGEECVETAQRVSKAIRFGLGEIQPGQSQTNEERLIYEFNDIVAVMEILQEEGIIAKVIDHKAIALKKEKVKTFVDYARKQGTIESVEGDVEILNCEQCHKDFEKNGDTMSYRSFYFCSSKCSNEWESVRRCEFCSKPLPEYGIYTKNGCDYCNEECYENELPF